MLGLGFLGFRMLVIVLEFIVPDECFTFGDCTVYGPWSGRKRRK